MAKGVRGLRTVGVNERLKGCGEGGKGCEESGALHWRSVGVEH